MSRWRAFAMNVGMATVAYVAFVMLVWGRTAGEAALDAAGFVVLYGALQLLFMKPWRA